MEFDAVIIGGGLGGLTAGAVLSRFGRKVLVIEQHYIPGGCATTFKRGDYVMEVGLHEMDGLHEYDIKTRIFDFLGISDSVEFKQVPELYRIKAKGIDITVPHGKKEFITVLGDAYPEDREALNKLLEVMEGVLKEIPRMPRDWKLKITMPFFPLLYPNVTKLSKYTVGSWLDEFIKNEELKFILQANLVYYSDDPYKLSMLYFSAAQSSYIGGGGHFIKGGSQQLSNYLAEKIEAAGGQVLLGKKVNSILMKNNRAAGVSFSDAFNDASAPREVYASAVIANAAVPLVKKMLPRRQALKLGGYAAEGLEESCSLISLYIGFNTDLKSIGVKHYSTFLYGDAGDSIKTVSALHRSNDWQRKPFVFVDYSQIDSGLAPKGKTFGVICAADYLEHWEHLRDEEYKQEKKRTAGILLERLEREFPGITAYIEYFEVGTAKTIQSYTLNPKGTPYGYAQTPEQSGLKRPQIKSPVKNLYFASAWSFPGAGFTGAIIGGFLCGNELNGQLGRGRLGRKVQGGFRIPDERAAALCSKRMIAENTVELIFEKPPGFEYKAGQYAVLALENPAFTELDMSHRPLSIVSHPDESSLRFAMRCGGGSSFKRSCLAMNEGEKAVVYGPMGDFSVRPGERPVVFLIAGIGITPVPALLKELEKGRFSKAVHLFYSNRSAEQASYHELFSEMGGAAGHSGAAEGGEAAGGFHYHPVFSGVDKRISVGTLGCLGRLEEYDFYVVGTSGFLESMTAMLMNESVPKSRIFVDDFGG